MIATLIKACAVLTAVRYVAGKHKGKSCYFLSTVLLPFHLIALPRTGLNLRDEQKKECTDGQHATQCSLITQRAFVKHILLTCSFSSPRSSVVCECTHYYIHVCFCIEDREARLAKIKVETINSLNTK